MSGNKLTSRKKVPGGVSLQIDGLEERLLLPEEYVLRRNLVEGVTLSDRQIEELKSESERHLCEQSLGRSLAMREHSRGELAVKLRRKGFSKTVIETALDKYIRMGAIDDARYAQIIGRSLIERRPCGKAYLCAYLQRRRISRTLADETAEMLLAGLDEEERATEALRQRWRRFGELELEVARRKSYNYLARRGFGYQAVKRAFQRLHNDQDEV